MIKEVAMKINKIELTDLVIRSFTYKQLTEKETRKMLKALWKKYWKQGLDSFQEKVVLSSHICFPNSKKERDNYIKEIIDRLSKKV